MEVFQSPVSLLKNFDKLWSFLDLTSSGAFFWNKYSNQAQWSKELYRTLGREVIAEAMTFEDVANSIHPDDRQKHREAVSQSFDLNKTFKVNVRFRHSNGHYVYLQTNGSWFVNDKNENVLFGYVNDVGETVANRDALL